MRSCIFDFDGTIVDSMPLWNRVPALYLLSLGVTADDDSVRVLEAMSMQQGAAYCIERYGLTCTPCEFIAGVNGMIAEEYALRINAKPCAVEFLRFLKQSRIRMCIATATAQKLIIPCLKRLGIADCFEFIADCSRLNTSKNSPYIYEYCIERLGVTAADVLIFEDAPHALRTCSRAGFQTVAVWDQSNDAEFYSLANLATARIRSFCDAQAELISLIKQNV